MPWDELLKDEAWVGDEAWFWRSQYQWELLEMPNCGLPSEAEDGESSRVWEAGPPTSDTSLWSRRTAEISAWSALGDSNWWLMFIDGRAHGKGVHAWDKADDEGMGTLSGVSTSAAQRIAYLQRLHSSSWERWTVDKIEQFQFSQQCLNNGLGKVAYARYMPRRQPESRACNQTDFAEGNTSVCFTNLLPEPDTYPTSGQEKRALLQALLADYYDAVDSLPTGSSRFGEGLPHLAKLFYSLADLHPFRDGNSRVRLWVLQTELVALGGHPVTMWDNYWWVYHQPSLTAVENMILEGYCSWEVSLLTGESAFAPSGLQKSIPYLDYDPVTKRCKRSPAPANWTKAE